MSFKMGMLCIRVKVFYTYDELTDESKSAERMIDDIMRNVRSHGSIRHEK